MKLDEYQDGAGSTAIYRSSMHLWYPTLGMCGEIGELTDAVIHKSDETSKEVGDVLWYLANVANDSCLSLSTTVGRKTFPVKVDNGCWGMDDVLEELAIAAGCVAESVKKAFRDDQIEMDCWGELRRPRQKKIKLGLRRVVYLLADLANNAEWCASLEECAQMNIDKLLSRAERGTLHGDGDNR